MNQQNNSMSSGLIAGKVQYMPDLSLHVKEYIKNNSNIEQPPFEEFNSPVKKSSRRKTSLTDWRKLYNIKQNPQHRFSQKKMNQTNRSFSKYHKTERVNNFTTPQRPKTVSKKQSYLDSAIVQNFYENQIFADKRVHTAKVRRHYEENSQKRPASIAISRRKMYQSNRQQKQKNSRCSQFNPVPHLWTNSKNQILQQVRTQKYERVKINRKYIIKKQDLKIQGLKNIQNLSFPIGFRYIGKQED